MVNGISSLPASLERLTYINVRNFDDECKSNKPYIFLVMDGKRLLPDGLKVLKINYFKGDMIIDDICVFPDSLEFLTIKEGKYNKIFFPKNLRYLDIDTFNGDMITNNIPVFPDSLESLSFQTRASFDTLYFPKYLRYLKISRCCKFSYFYDDGKKVLPDTIEELYICHYTPSHHKYLHNNKLGLPASLKSYTYSGLPYIYENYVCVRSLVMLMVQGLHL